MGGHIMKQFLRAIPVILFIACSGIINAQPYIQQGEKLVGTGSVGISYQGESIAISADGNTAIVGGYGDNHYQGAAWIFTRENGKWIQQGNKLTETGRYPTQNMGQSVSITADGNTVIIGTYHEGQGGAWVYARKNGNWTRQGSLLFGAGGTSQGQSVSISGDGNTVVLGGPFHNNRQGAVWVFIKENGVWKQQGDKISLPDTASKANLGTSVALSADGNTLIAGGFFDYGWTGGAWFFSRNKGVWTQQGGFLFKNYNTCGIATVKISADGNTAIVGASFHDKGGAFIYVRENGVWKQQGDKLLGTGATPGNTWQGHSVSISGDGNTAVVGGKLKNKINALGATCVFKRKDGVWAQLGDKLFGSGEVGNSDQGGTVDISSDASTIIVGGPYDDSTKGAVWIFEKKSYSITTSAGEGGKITPCGNVKVFSGESQTFTITPDKYWFIDSVIIDGISKEPLLVYTFSDVQYDHSIYVKFRPTLISISGKVSLDEQEKKNLKLLLWDKTGMPYKAYLSPALTHSSGRYSFKDVPAADSLQVYIMEPLGFEADENPKVLSVIDINEPEIRHVNFRLERLLKENNAQASEYWAEQFRYYAECKKGAPAEESLEQLQEYLKKIREHYTPYFGLFRNLATVEDWYSVFYYASRFRNYDFTSKAELAALLLNIVSLKLPQYYVTTMDKRTAGECLSFISELAMMDDRANNVSIYYMSYKLNMRQILTGGIVPESSVFYKFNGPENHNEINSQIPDQYKLYSNFPNPFNPSTNIEFDIAGQSYVSLIIYDINGREIERLADRMMQPGHYRLQWNAAKYPSGMYLCRMNAGEFTDTKKLIFLK